jgi:hypothetical protein
VGGAHRPQNFPAVATLESPQKVSDRSFSAVISIKPDTGGFQQRFDTILQRARRPRTILSAAGRATSELLKKHFQSKDRTNINSLAPDRRRRFWFEVEKSVQSPIVSDDSTLIHITHPAIAQKVFGGPIVAKRVKNLAIPVSPDAYGRKPSSFEEETGLKLFVLHQAGVAAGSNGSIVLAAIRDRASKTVEVEYVLKSRVEQSADPTALPSEDRMQETILSAALAALNRQLRTP